MTSNGPKSLTERKIIVIFLKRLDEKLIRDFYWNITKNEAIEISAITGGMAVRVRITNDTGANTDIFFFTVRVFIVTPCLLTMRVTPFAR